MVCNLLNRVYSKSIVNGTLDSFRHKFSLSYIELGSHRLRGIHNDHISPWTGLLYNEMSLQNLSYILELKGELY